MNNIFERFNRLKTWVELDCRDEIQKELFKKEYNDMINLSESELVNQIHRIDFIKEHLFTCGQTYYYLFMNDIRKYKLNTTLTVLQAVSKFKKLIK